MNTNNIAIESIKSNTVKNYLKKINHVFSTVEQIIIIFNSEIELYRKIGIFNYLLNNEDTDANIKDELKELLNNIERFTDVLNKNENTALLFRDTDDDTKCIKNLDYLKSYISDNEYRINSNVIELIDLTTSEVIYYITVNDKLEIINFIAYNDNNNIIKSLTFGYVNIPNEFKVGDVVNVYGLKEEYVVIQDSKIPVHLIDKCDLYDSCITVVPKTAFNDNGTYLEQINNIFRGRINKLSTDVDTLDIISKKHEHVDITLVEKCESSDINE